MFVILKSSVRILCAAVCGAYRMHRSVTFASLALQRRNMLMSFSRELHYCGSCPLPIGLHIPAWNARTVNDACMLREISVVYILH